MQYVAMLSVHGPKKAMGYFAKYKKVVTEFWPGLRKARRTTEFGSDNSHELDRQDDETNAHFRFGFQAGREREGFPNYPSSPVGLFCSHSD